MITVAQHTINAPGFTAQSFDRAIQRAHDEGLIVRRIPDLIMSLEVINPTHGTSYVTTRYECSCPAGQRGGPCKHRAYSIFLKDIVGAKH